MTSSLFRSGLSSGALLSSGAVLLQKLVVLSQINHINVVNLLGCFLRDRSSLVYEFIKYTNILLDHNLTAKVYKYTNILLDHNLTAKVFDFRASRIVPLDHSQITTLLQGTLRYLDAEYLQTSVLIEKSVVYSFTIIAELLTKRKHYLFAMYFVSSMKEDCLLHIMDNSDAEMLRI
ncbi:wall-associated receptor kinase-like protein [Medicago truncatula]|uniref:Wall-associated receptor kinase-like protein n=1 Tax=Medicago truncatula TaxID=3880 RepID=G7JUM0_MEDTR|nr:wall-associated receptor kinase-like protein [Medicago truncatula]